MFDFISKTAGCNAVCSTAQVKLLALTQSVPNLIGKTAGSNTITSVSYVRLLLQLLLNLLDRLQPLTWLLINVIGKMLALMLNLI